jgi:predicted RecA/RadA family phage recombinase
MKKLFSKIPIMGLALIAVILVFGIAAAFAASPQDSSAATGTAGLMSLMFIGLATSVPSDSLSNLRPGKYTHNVATVPGDTIVVNGCVLVAVNTADANAENVYVYAGKHTMPKEAPLVINFLDEVYWDAGAGKVTKTAGGNTPCGYCQEAALSADTTVTIMLQPTNTFAVGTITLANGQILIGNAGGEAAANALSGDVTITNTGVASLKETTIKYATVNLTNANIKALRATPKELVAAPGANKIVEFVSAVLFLDYGANVLTESADNLAVRYENTTGALASQAIEATGFIDATADTLTNALPKIDAIVAAASGLNKALVLHNTGDGEYAGNAGADTVIKVKVAYRVHDVTV